MLRSAARVSSAPEPRPYIGGLTPLRGFAAVWVVAYHFDDLFGRLLPRQSSLLVAHGYAMVDFFFVLSGFVITHVYGERLAGGGEARDVGGYVRARLLRLYPVHLLALGTHALLYAVVLSVPGLAALPELGRYYDLPKLLSQLVLGQAVWLGGVYGWNTPSWSVSAEWWTYLLALGIIPALHHAPGSARRMLWPAAGVALLGAITAATLLLGKGTLRLGPDQILLRCVLEFSFGVCVYQWYRHASSRALAHDAAFWAALAALGLLAHLARGMDYLLVPLFGVLIVATARNRGRVQRLLEKRALRWLGDASYPIYMLHFGVLMAFFLAQVTIRESTERIVYEPVVLWGLFGVCLAVVLAGAALVHRWVERPVQRWAHRARE